MSNPIRLTPDRGPDGGPVYAETPIDPLAPGGPVPAEPFNTVTASLFILIAVYWAAILWGRYRQFQFLTGAIPILLAGGIGGTLYHATRTHRAYFLLDVIPITLLGAAASVYLTLKLGRYYSRTRLALSVIGLVGFYALTNRVLFQLVDFGPGNLRVNLSYALLAVMILLPMGVVLVKTRFRHGNWVLVGLVAFAIAWGCRLVDRTFASTLPMGTHWLWHVFGAVATQAVTIYLYRIERDAVTRPQRGS